MLGCIVLRISMHMLCLQGVAGRPEQLPAHETKFHMSEGWCSFLRIRQKFQKSRHRRDLRHERARQQHLEHVDARDEGIDSCCSHSDMPAPVGSHQDAQDTCLRWKAGPSVSAGVRI